MDEARQLSLEDSATPEGVPSARDPNKMYYPKFDGENWSCDCEHFKFRHTPCRHILVKQAESKTKYKGGVRDTSLQAYLEIISDPGSLNDIYQDILVALHEIGKPSTDREIARHLELSDPNKVRPRRNELADPAHFHHPLVKETGKKKECSVTGKTSYVWELTDYGRKLVKNYIVET